MSKNRIEALSDGVVAIVITLLVLNLKSPVTDSLNGLLNLRSQIIAYISTFFFIAVIWQNHHQLIALSENINLKNIWANIFWLFCLTLSPFVTEWIGKYPHSLLPAISYTIVFFMWSISYNLLANSLLKNNKNTVYERVLENDNRSKISIIINILIFIGVFYYPPIALIGRIIISIIWIRPYRKIN